MLSWLKLLIKLLLLHLVGCLYYYINDARSHKHQIFAKYPMTDENQALTWPKDNTHWNSVEGIVLKTQSVTVAVISDNCNYYAFNDGNRPKFLLNMHSLLCTYRTRVCLCGGPTERRVSPSSLMIGCALCCIYIENNPWQSCLLL